MLSPDAAAATYHHVAEDPWIPSGLSFKVPGLPSFVTALLGDWKSRNQANPSSPISNMGKPNTCLVADLWRGRWKWCTLPSGPSQYERPTPLVEGDTMLAAATGERRILTLQPLLSAGLDLSELH